MNRRYTFMNILRIIALAVVIGYHFLVDIYQRGLCAIQNPGVHVVFGSVNLVIEAVSIFFILSGSGLVLMMRRREAALRDSGTGNGSNVSRWGYYYAGRFFRILVPFYITYIACLVCRLISDGAPLFEGVPWWRIIFTVAGIDEYLSMTGAATFSLGIGEWFLGALIIMYAVFPLLYTAMKKWKWQTFVIATVYYAVVILTYRSDIVWYNNVLVKIYDFILGMFLAFEFEDLETLGKTKLPAVILPLLAAAAAAFAVIGIHPAFTNIVICGCVFLIGFFLELLIGDTPLVSRFSAWLCSYEYYVFLVHHVVIYRFHEPMQDAHVIMSKAGIPVLFGIELAVIVLFAAAVRWITGRISPAGSRSDQSGRKRR